MAHGPQPPKILMSHCWSGHFRDFMFVVDKVGHVVELIGGKSEHQLNSVFFPIIIIQ